MSKELLLNPTDYVGVSFGLSRLLWLQLRFWVEEIELKESGKHR